MSAFNDPRYLAAQGLIQPLPTVIDHDRPCAKCSYNLRGLTIGGICPECGTGITSLAVVKVLGDTMMDAPRAYVRRFAAAMIVAFIGMVLNVAAVFTIVSTTILNSVFGFYRSGGINTPTVPTASNTFWAAVVALGSLAWLAGLIVATLPRPAPVDAPQPRERGEWWRLRALSWITQAGWVVGAGLSLAVAALAPTNLFGPPPQWMTVCSTIAAIGFLVALVGVIPTAVLLARYAEWIPDADLGWRFRTSAWTVGMSGALMILTGVTPPGLPSFIGFIPFILWLCVGVMWLLFIGALLVLFWSLGQMATTACAGVQSQRLRDERDQRMLERMRQEREQHLARLALEPHARETSPGVRKVGTAPNRPPVQR